MSQETIDRAAAQVAGAVVVVASVKLDKRIKDARSAALAALDKRKPAELTAWRKAARNEATKYTPAKNAGDDHAEDG